MWDDDEIDSLTQTTIVIGSGRVVYDLSEAACSIEDLIASLEEAREEGATHVVLSSGNHRGAQWMRLTDGFSWADR